MDGTTITYDGSGGLTLASPPGSRVGGQPVGGSAPTAGQVLKFDGTQWTAGALAQAGSASAGYLSSGDWLAFNGRQPALGNVPLNKAGDTMAGPLNMGSQDISNTGTISLAAAKLLGLGVASTDPTGLVTADKGKIWFNGGIKYWDGAATQTLGVAGGGLQFLNSQSGTTQSFGVPGSSGTAPNWVSAVNVHTLNLPLAATGGTTAGLLSNSDWTVFNGKDPFVTAGTTAQFYRGDKSWQTLSTAVVPEAAGAVYFNTARAQGALTATAPLAYNGTGTYSLPVANGTANGYLSSTDWTSFAGKQANLGFTPVNKAGDTLGGSLNAGGFTVANLAAPSAGADAATKTYADGINTALSGAMLKKDGSVALTSTWNEGAQAATSRARRSGPSAA